ncbi:hypothetical protein DSECCO2_351800 [anaerobic digester metagenome]
MCRRDRGRAVPHEPLRRPVQHAPALVRKAPHAPGQGQKNLVGRLPGHRPLGPQHLCRVGRRGRAQVGHEVGDGRVHLVPHAADHGQTAAEESLGHGLGVEGPQVLQRPAAADEHHDLGPAVPVRPVQGRGDLGRGAVALHQARVEPHDGPVPPVPGHAQKILQGSALGRGDDGHPARVARRRHLSLGVEIPLGRQLGLHGLEGHGQLTHALPLHQLGHQLVGPARRVHVHAPGHEHFHPVG